MNTLFWVSTKLVRWLLLLKFGVIVSNAAEKPALTAEAVTQLFEAAFTHFPRIYFEADIVKEEPRGTEEEFSKQFAGINEALRNSDARLKSDARAALNAARANSVRQALSGLRNFKIREWYSEKCYKRDENDLDEKPFDDKVKYTRTFALIGDKSISEFLSYEALHIAKSVALTKDPSTTYGTFQLWRAVGVDEHFDLPLIASLADLEQFTRGGELVGHRTDCRAISISRERLLRLTEGSDTDWSLAVGDEVLDGLPTTKVKLNGRYMDVLFSTTPSLFENTYWFARMSGRLALIQAYQTNRAFGTSCRSKRGEFSETGFPGYYENIVSRQGTSSKLRCKFHAISTDFGAPDTSVFSTTFPKDYLVSDHSTGTAVLLHDTMPEVPKLGTNLKTRRYLLSIIVVGSLVPFAIYYFIGKKRGK